jgi:hypothetical protein
MLGYEKYECEFPKLPWQSLRRSGTWRSGIGPSRWPISFPSAQTVFCVASM